MTSLRFILASLRHYRRIHVAVVLGVAVATAVLTGALVVGDSMGGSLRELTLERLGYIDSALVTSHLFREALADELVADPEFQKYFTGAEPAILLTGTLQSGSGNDTRRATAISIVGCRDSFGDLRYGKAPSVWSTVAVAPPSVPYLDGDEIALTQPIADELGVREGDTVLVRIPAQGSIPADSPLGEKMDTSIGRQFKVKGVLGVKGQARFGLFPSQRQPRNAFVALATLQRMLSKPERANAILVATDHAERASGEDAQKVLRRVFQPRAEDFALRVDELSAPTACVQISADQLVLPDAVVTATEAFRDTSVQPVVTYLANTIEVGEGPDKRKIPYSTITGVDSNERLGPLMDEAGQPIALSDDEIVLNDWAASDMQAKVGDSITVTYYEPESTHGQLRERKPAPTFKLKAIAPLESPEGKPTAAADPMLTPELPGVTDQSSIRDWDLPFELVETIRQQDEDYWDKYRTAPKAFISLAAAKRLWPSRWGTVSLLRLRDGEAASAAVDPANVLAQAIDPATLGMTFLSVKQLGLEAASGTTPFGVLFLCFSFFLIAAALMLIAILFQLGIQQRARELGTLSAIGIGRRRITSLLGREGRLIAVLGATLGVVGGILYAWLMITGLRTWWLAAISTPFLELHVSWPSLAIGWLAGVVLSWVTIRWTIHRLTRSPASQLLSGSFASGVNAVRKQSRNAVWPVARAVLLLFIAGLILLGFRLQGQAQAGTFFGSGALVLAVLLGEIRQRLRTGGQVLAASRPLSLLRLSWLNATRHPGRSTLTIGLVAAASFLILAISAFRLETTDAGTGGFEFVATSDRPIHFDLNTDEGRMELGFSDAAAKHLAQRNIYSLRVSDGEDASCLNLYQPTQPRVLGMPIDLVQRGGFQWYAVARSQNDPIQNVGATAEVVDQANPWTNLYKGLGSDSRGQPVVPVVLDAATAVYSLHLRGVGSPLTIRDAAGQPVTLQVVGLLKNSVLQGSLLISEDHFLRLFPDTGGYRFFLIEPMMGDSTVGDAPNISKLLESTLASEGFDVVEARQQLAAFLAVQNTYLSTFQSLGALGLLLGTIGLAVVQLRNVLERRAELALLRAAGFAPSRLVWMVICENAVLLLGGLAVGSAAAAVALVPQWAPQNANIPWAALGALLATIALVGLAAGWLATRSVLRAPILPALRGD